MRILFDQSAPAPLRGHLKGHVVTEARDRGWDRLVNGELLDEAEAAGFEIFLTADKNLRYQQNLAASQDRSRSNRQCAMARTAKICRSSGRRGAG
jgi:hypothetical protein